LSQLIAQLGVSDIVTLKGQLSFAEVMEHYHRADVFVLPSVVAEDGDRDGIPNVLLEAMAMQLPAVSTTVSGIPELVEDGANGCLVPAGDDTALADALARLLDDAALRKSLGKAGRVKVARDFDIQRNVSQLLALYSQQLARSQAPQDAIG
jgi:glycosyltransferase involved in cell wall biosynthesis